MVNEDTHIVNFTASPVGRASQPGASVRRARLATSTYAGKS